MSGAKPNACWRTITCTGQHGGPQARLEYVVIGSRTILLLRNLVHGTCEALISHLVRLLRTDKAQGHS
eukprot:3291390-Pleurochrysis_carterae.AAC.1